jgi:hypothetical protein
LYPAIYRILGISGIVSLIGMNEGRGRHTSS